MRLLKITFVAVVGCYIALCVGLYFEQAKFIFAPQRDIAFTPKSYGCEFQEVLIPVNLQTMHAWWIPAGPRESSQMGSRTLIYSHGNGGDMSANAEHACRLRNLGLNVLLYDYRGYGNSSNEQPTEDTVFADSEAAWKYLAKRDVPPAKIIIYGHSLGGAVAVEMAKKHPDANALVVESSFTSIHDMADLSGNFRIFPLTLILNQRLDSLAKIREIQMPSLFIHGTADRVVPPEMGRQLYEASGARRKELFLVKNAGHENCAAMAGDAYQQKVSKFLTSKD